MKKLKVFELFAGIGAPRKALTKLEINHESVGYSEIDKHAIKAYCSIHEDVEANNFGDIAKIKKLPNDIDLLFHGSPCQDFSLAGSRKGGEEGSNTRSSLMWETVRLITDAMPKIVMWENVTGALVGESEKNFQKYLKEMEKMGYKNTYEVLAGTEFNVPQVRRRVFVISFLNGEGYKNLENIKKELLEMKLMDLLESGVEEKYFLGSEKLEKIDIQMKKLNYYNHEQEDRIKSVDGVSEALTTRKRIKILVPIDTKEKYREAEAGDGIYVDRPHQKRGTVQKGKVPTLKTSCKDIAIIDNKYRVRYLTPKESMLLMGFDEKDYKLIKDGIPETSVYKVAGNSIIVDVLMGIFKLVYLGEEKSNVQTELF